VFVSLKAEGVHEDFKVKCWGDNSHKQLEVPALHDTKQ